MYGRPLIWTELGPNRPNRNGVMHAKLLNDLICNLQDRKDTPLPKQVSSSRYDKAVPSGLTFTRKNAWSNLKLNQSAFLYCYFLIPVQTTEEKLGVSFYCSWMGCLIREPLIKSNVQLNLLTQVRWNFAFWNHKRAHNSAAYNLKQKKETQR